MLAPPHAVDMLLLLARFCILHGSLGASSKFRKCDLLWDNCQAPLLPWRQASPPSEIPPLGSLYRLDPLFFIAVNGLYVQPCHSGFSHLMKQELNHGGGGDVVGGRGVRLSLIGLLHTQSRLMSALPPVSSHKS